jgi:hypothetical protein
VDGALRAGDEFSAKAGALYAVAYSIKQRCKGDGRDFAMPKLEGLWWVDGNVDGLKVRLPDFVDEAVAMQARDAAPRAKKEPLIKEVLFGRIHEGRCVQQSNALMSRWNPRAPVRRSQILTSYWNAIYIV